MSRSLAQFPALQKVLIREDADEAERSAIERERDRPRGAEAKEYVHRNAREISSEIERYRLVSDGQRA